MKSGKHIINLYSCIIGIACCFSCTNEENSIIQDNGDLLIINAEIENTRNVVTSTTFQSGDQIGVFVKTIDGQDYTDNSRNIQAIYRDKYWQMASNVKLNDATAIVHAYYPYQENTGTELDSIDIDLTPDVNTGQKDYMYGYNINDINISNHTAYIKFNHALARITLAVTKSANDVGAGVISTVRIENDTLYNRLNTTNGIMLEPIGKDTWISTKGKMDIRTGKIIKTSDPNAVIELPVNRTISTSEIQYIDFLIIPCGSTVRPSNVTGGGICAILTIDGCEYKVSLNLPPAESSSDGENIETGIAAPWEAGKQYTYPITINRNSIMSGEPARIGDYYYSDRTWSTEFNEAKECIGIVFALTDIKGGEINRELVESNHGRIIALKDASSSCQWGNLKEDVEGIPNFENTSGDSSEKVYFSLDSYGRITQWPIEGANIDFQGYENTQFINRQEYPAGYACYTYQAAGTQSGEWYLPAYGELTLLNMMYRYGFIRNSVQNVFEDWYDDDYWSSSEREYNVNYDALRIFVTNIKNSTGRVVMKDNYCRARAAMHF